MGMIHQPLTQVDFALRAETITSRLISVLNEALHAAGVAVDARPTDIAAHFDIDMKLAWKVSHLLRSSSPAEVLGGLPGRGGFVKLLSGLKHAKVSQKHLDGLQATFDEILTDVASHGGGKATYESMILGMGANSELPLAVTQRRALMHSMTSVIGLQCRSLFALDVIGPRSESGGFERMSVRSYDGIFRLWSGVPWCLRIPRIGTVGEGVSRHTVSAIGGSGDLDGRLLSEYSGLSGIKIELRSDGHPDFEDFSLELDGIGPRHAARIVHGCHMSHEGLGAGHLQSLRIDLPVQHCELDLIIHRSWLADIGPITASVFHPGLGRDLGTDDSWTTRLPIELKSSSGDDEEPAFAAPVGWSAGQHSHLVDQGIESLGHDRREYIVQRVAFSYPPMPVDIVHGELA